MKLVYSRGVAALLACAPMAPVLAADAAPTPAKPDDKIPEAKVWTTKHQMNIAGKPLAYSATAGTMQIKNDKDEPVALFGYTAYVKDGKEDEQRTRPIVF